MSQSLSGRMKELRGINKALKTEPRTCYYIEGAKPVHGVYKVSLIPKHSPSLSVSPTAAPSFSLSSSDANFETARMGDDSEGKVCLLCEQEDLSFRSPAPTQKPDTALHLSNPGDGSRDTHKS